MRKLLVNQWKKANLYLKRYKIKHQTEKHCEYHLIINIINCSACDMSDNVFTREELNNSVHVIMIPSCDHCYEFIISNVHPKYNINNLLKSNDLSDIGISLQRCNYNILDSVKCRTISLCNEEDCLKYILNCNVYTKNIIIKQSAYLKDWFVKNFEMLINIINYLKINAEYDIFKSYIHHQEFQKLLNEYEQNIYKIYEEGVLVTYYLRPV